MPRVSRSSASGRSRRGPRRKRRPTPASRKRLVRFRMASRREAVAPTVDRVLAAAVAAGLSGEQRDNLAVPVAESRSKAERHERLSDTVGVDEQTVVETRVLYMSDATWWRDT